MGILWNIVGKNYGIHWIKLSNILGKSYGYIMGYRGKNMRYIG